LAGVASRGCCWPVLSLRVLGSSLVGCSAVLALVARGGLAHRGTSSLHSSSMELEVMSIAILMLDHWTDGIMCGPRKACSCRPSAHSTCRCSGV
jgi:hypothetical protein